MDGLELKLDSIDSLDDATKSLYTQDGEKFKLNPVVASIQTRITKMDGKVAELLTETKAAKNKATQAAEAERIKAQEIENKKLEGLEKDKDFESFKKSIEEKHARELQEAKARGDSYKKMTIGLSSEQKALQLATEIAGTINGESMVGFLEPQFTERLRTVFTDGKPSIEVLDADGNLSAMNLKELQSEIAAIPKNSGLVIGSKGSGGGFKPNNGGGKGFVDTSKMSPREKIEYARQ